MEVMWSQHTPYIEPFDMQHLIYIGILVSILALMIRNRDSLRENRKLYGMVILGLSVFQQILLYTWYWMEMGFNLSESLPLHICRISTLLGIWFLISKKHKVLDVMFFFGLYAYGSFLYPSRVYPVQHAIGISFVLNHAITILLPWFGHIAARAAAAKRSRNSTSVNSILRLAANLGIVNSLGRWFFRSGRRWRWAHPRRSRPGPRTR